MSNVSEIGSTPVLTIRQQAEAEVKKELSNKALTKMKDILRQRATAIAVVAAFDAQITDLERQIDDGTF